MNPKRNKASAAKARLGRFSSSIEDDQELLSGSLGKHDDHCSLPKNWKFAVVGCGSNAFGQLNVDEVMSSKLQYVPLPIDRDNQDSEIEQIATGSSISSVLLSKKGGVYYWGSGNGSQYRTPVGLKIDPRCVVKQISCGESHSAFISQTGKVFTVGNGEHGALGHGSKSSLSAPKMVAALAKLCCLQVSCGPYHTAFIAGKDDDIGFVRFPPSAAPVNIFEEWEGEPTGKFDRVLDGSLVCASLFTCGVGKTGQLGHGENSPMMKTPREVKWFSENGHRVGKVSCGMHHTVVIAVPVHSMRFLTSVFTFGWGEHGRLGHGNEHNSNLPVEVSFPEPFHAIDVSAGEQHTLATSGRQNGCYAWGNNAFGQCAAGSPSAAEFCLTPNKIPIPEGIRVVQVTAGGRHSAAISACEKLLMWGWGEEGQLGNGTEKDSWLPRPVRLPTIQDSKCIPITASLGMCHTLVVVRNQSYVYSPTAEQIEVVEEKEEENAVLPIVSNVSNTVESKLSCALSPAPLLDEAFLQKQSIFVVEDVVEEEKPIQSLKDILSSRESRDNDNRELCTVLGKYSADVESEPTTEQVEVEDETPPELSIVDEVQQSSEIISDIEIVKEDKVISKQMTSQQNTKERNMEQYFYKEGQNLDNCYVANSARRAELRKQKKSSATTDATPVPPKGSKSTSSYHRKLSK